MRCFIDLNANSPMVVKRIVTEKIFNVSERYYVLYISKVDIPGRIMKSRLQYW